jgi:hypothetical protein
MPDKQWGMADGKPAKNPEKARRDEQLKAALRENLRRRKAQVRGRERATSDEPPEPSRKPDR